MLFNSSEKPFKPSNMVVMRYCLPGDQTERKRRGHLIFDLSTPHQRKEYHNAGSTTLWGYDHKGK